VGHTLAEFPPHHRILLLGPTGVDKQTAALRLRDHIASRLGHRIIFIDFENAFLKPHLKSWMTFLGQDIAQQASTWRQAWDEFTQTLDDNITILGLHATYVSSVLGLRFPIHIPSICSEFKPTIIISFIDDVYRMWARTEDRAAGRDYEGRPSFEQLLVARRAEQSLGDLILSHTGNRRARHILCAAGNNLDALTNLIIFDAPVTYLSFPISAARQLQAKGDDTFIQLINRAHHLAAAEMMAVPQRSFISPLAIDELPILAKIPERADAAELAFDPRKDRWNSEELWGDPALCILPPTTKELRFPVAQVDEAAAAIRTDVGWRDRRLVLQSRSLAIVCPKDPEEDRITRGVGEEIQTAVAVGIVCNYWQRPESDPGDFVGKQFPAAGSMGIGQNQALVRRMATLEELIRVRP
jgi:hypothetical protein